MIEFRWHAENPDVVGVYVDDQPVLDVPIDEFDAAHERLLAERGEES